MSTANAPHTAVGTRTAHASHPAVCIVAESFFPNVDGQATHSRSLAGALAARGAPVFVLTRRDESDYPAREIVDGVNVVRLGPTSASGVLGRYLGMLPIAWQLWKRRREWSVLLVSNLRILGLPAVGVARLLGRPCVLRIDTCGEMTGAYATNFEERPTLAHRVLGLYFRLRNAALLFGDRFVSISTPIRAEFVESGVPESDIVDITNGVDVDRFSPAMQTTRAAARASLGIPAESRVIAYTGRLTREKGLDTLVESFRVLASDRPDLHLLLVGSGQGMTLSCEPMLREFTGRHGLEGRVHFTGSVTDVEHYVQLADVFALLSSTEALGLSLLEAMACEVASIGSAVGGILDILQDGENGLLVEYGDVEGTTRALARLLDDEALRERCGRAGRETVVARYSLESVADRYMALVHELST